MQVRADGLVGGRGGQGRALEERQQRPEVQEGQRGDPRRAIPERRLEGVGVDQGLRGAADVRDGVQRGGDRHLAVEHRVVELHPRTQAQAEGLGPGDRALLEHRHLAGPSGGWGEGQDHRALEPGQRLAGGALVAGGGDECERRRRSGRLQPQRHLAPEYRRHVALEVQPRAAGVPGSAGEQARHRRRRAAGQGRKQAAGRAVDAPEAQVAQRIARDRVGQARLEREEAPGPGGAPVDEAVHPQAGAVALGAQRQPGGDQTGLLQQRSGRPERTGVRGQQPGHPPGRQVGVDRAVRRQTGGRPAEGGCAAQAAQAAAPDVDRRLHPGRRPDDQIAPQEGRGQAAVARDRHALIGRRDRRPRRAAQERVSPVPVGHRDDGERRGGGAGRVEQGDRRLGAQPRAHVPLVRQSRADRGEPAGHRVAHLGAAGEAPQQLVGAADRLAVGVGRNVQVGQRGVGDQPGGARGGRPLAPAEQQDRGGRGGGEDGRPGQRPPGWSQVATGRPRRPRPARRSRRSTKSMTTGTPSRRKRSRSRFSR